MYDFLTPYLRHWRKSKGGIHGHIQKTKRRLARRGVYQGHAHIGDLHHQAESPGLGGGPGQTEKAGAGGAMPRYRPGWMLRNYITVSQVFYSMAQMIKDWL